MVNGSNPTSPSTRLKTDKDSQNAKRVKKTSPLDVSQTDIKVIITSEMIEKNQHLMSIMSEFQVDLIEPFAAKEFGLILGDNDDDVAERICDIMQKHFLLLLNSKNNSPETANDLHNNPDLQVMLHQIFPEICRDLTEIFEQEINKNSNNAPSA
ncbi:MAG: hypothetical protein ACJARD_000682 [Alphaproteobacteria bacterium]|jgi:hypothetical protein